MKKTIFVFVLFIIGISIFAESIGVIYSGYADDWYKGKHTSEIEQAGFEKDLIKNIDVSKTNLNNYKILIATRFYNEADTIDFSNTNIGNYVKNGGILIITDAFTNNGTDWLKKSFDLIYTSHMVAPYCGSHVTYIGKNQLLNNISTIYLNENKTLKVSNNCTILATDKDKNPTLIAKKIGKGLLVVGNIGYKQNFPSAEFIKNCLNFVNENKSLEKTNLVLNINAEKDIKIDDTFKVKVLYPNYRNIVQSKDPNKILSLKFNVKDIKNYYYRVTILKDNVVINKENIKNSDYYKYDISKFLPGKYAYLVELVADNKVIKEYKRFFTVLEPSDYEVTFDSKRICYLNGKPFFPICLYHCGEIIINNLNSKRKEGIPELNFEEVNQDIADHGFNVAIAFSSVPMDDNHVKSFMDKGMIFNLELGTVLDENILKAQVDKNNKYNTGLFYYTVDEPIYKKLDNAKVMYEILNRIDPHRPVGAAINIPYVFYKSQDVFDIMMPDPYVWVYGNMTPSLNEMLPSIKASLECSDYEKPMWAVPQAFGFGEGVKRFNIPNYKQVRAQMYYFLIHGATGFAWYSYESGETAPTLPYNSWCIKGTDIWNHFKELNQEMQDFFPIMYKGESVGSIKGNNNKVHSNIWKCDGKNYAIIVNPDPKDYSVTYNIKNVKPYFEKYNYNMFEKQGKTTFKLEPYESIIITY